MLKYVALVRRLPNVTHEQLVDHWTNKHMPGVRDLIRPDHYSITFFKQRPDVPFDGMAHGVVRRCRTWS